MEPDFRRTAAEHRAALGALLAGLGARPGTERLELAGCAGRVLAGDLSAPLPLPGFDNSQMDGYAVRAADLGPAGGRAVLDVAAPIPAGRPAPALAPGTAAPIMTGAMLPAGADAVVPIEEADPPAFPDPGAGARVGLPGGTEPGRFIRRAGSDIAAGAVALPAGTRLAPRHLGLAAALGVPALEVRRRPTAVLLATGDEVAPPGADLAPGQLHDANTTLLAALLAEAGLAVRPAAPSTDSVAAFTRTLAAALADGPADLVVTSGGISQGAYEVVRQALAGHGVAFGSVALQPGGPQGAGTLALPGAPAVPLVAFPGNPVSGAVSFELLLRPVLAAELGLAPRSTVAARLAEPLRGSPRGKLQARRAHYADGTVRPVGGPSSHLLHALARANALVLVPEEATSLAAGEPATTLLIGDAP